MIEIDKSQLNVKDRESLTYTENLLDFANQVGLAKPLCKLVVDNECILSIWVNGEPTRYINQIKLFENGEQLGFITTGTRRLAGVKENVYGVGSFRIRKERGGQATQTKDMKVALRTVKRMLISRADDELTELIKDKVSGSISHLLYQAKNSVRWDVDNDEEIIFYIMQAYHGRKRGADTVSLPSKIVSVRDTKEHEQKCETFEAISDIELAHNAKTGYGVMLKADEGYIVYDYASNALEKYPSFYGLPVHLQEKVGIFKLLKDDEPVFKIGCKFNDGKIFYIYPNLNHIQPKTDV